jgi:S1-C subfamily serine protease
MVSVLLAAAVGAALSGAILFAYYQYRLQQTEDTVNRFAGAYEETLSKALGEIREERDDARSQIRAELGPLQELQASEETLAELVETTKDSVLFVSTRDEVGQPKVGSAFVVTADAENSYLLTSLDVVRASTSRPGPPLVVRKGDDEFAATLWTWDESRDLALLVVEKGNLARLSWAPSRPALGLGQRVFAVAGVGGAGASITQGFVADVSASGVQHDASVSGAFEGGPLINSKGEVVGVATSAYAPLGFPSRDVTYAPPVRAACDRVLRCPGGDPGGAPDRR